MAFDHSGTISVERTGDQRIDGVLPAAKWRNPTIAYSDPDSPLDYGATYESDQNDNGISVQRESFSQLSGSQLAVARSALEVEYRGAVTARAGFCVEGFTELGLVYAGPGSGEAEVRLANSSDAGGAYAYLPMPYEYGGDVWFGTAGDEPEQGNYDFLTIFHELGHALGLRHGHEESGFGSVPARYDSLEYSVMTYSSFVGGTENDYSTFERGGAPQCFMMFDIAALQYMYGANFEVNSGDTIYSWSPSDGMTRVDGEVALAPASNRIFATIWDGGGSDWYDLSAYDTDLEVDLRPGHHSLFSRLQLSDLGGGPNDGLARGNIFNALRYRGDERSLIENALGGSGQDTLRGNAADNTLLGSAGADTILGRAGDDRLNGGAGPDLLTGGPGADTLRGGAGDDRFVFLDAAESRGRTPDRLVKLGGAAAFSQASREGGDIVDLSGIDANETLPGDQAFDLGDAWTTGGLWASEQNGFTCLRGDTDTDRWPEFKLIIEDGRTLASAYLEQDFVL